MEKSQIINFIILLITAPIGVKLFDYCKDSLQNYLKNRKEKNEKASQHEIDLKKLEQIRAVDLTNVSRENFTALMNAATEMAQRATERARIAEEERDQEKELRENRENEFKLKFAALDEEIRGLRDEIATGKNEHRSCNLIREQVERNLRLLLDTFRIAYWEADQLGKCIFVNDTFLELTGLEEEKCKGDGWFNAIDTNDINRVSVQWRRFIRSQQAHTSFEFCFRHAKTKECVKVSVQCNAIMLNGFEIFKYTAQTSPLAPK